MPFFEKARPVWNTSLADERNVTVGLCSAPLCAGTYTFKAATSGFYHLFVNGTFVHFGPARCAHGFYRVDELTLTLTENENYVAVEVNNSYLNGFGQLRQNGFIEAELAASDGTVIAATGNSGFDAFMLHERVRKVQRYSFQRDFAEAYRFEGNVHAWRVGHPDKNAEPFTPGETEPKKLVERRIPIGDYPVIVPKSRLWYGDFETGVAGEVYKDRSLIKLHDPTAGLLEGYDESELDLHLSDEAQGFRYTTRTDDVTDYSGKTSLSAGKYEAFRFDGEHTGLLGATLVCHEDAEVCFMFSEVLHGDDVRPIADWCNMIRIDMKPGTYDFRTCEPFGMQYLKIACVSGKVDVLDVNLVAIVCPEKITASYTGSDPATAKIFEAAKQSFMQNCVDIFMDCPTRERAGWLCDSFFTARSERFFTGKNDIEHNFLENFLLAEHYPNVPDGMLPMCYPSDHYDGNYIPNWAMWFVLELEDRQKRTGDKAFAEAYKEKVYRLLDFFKNYENKDGLLEKLEAWVFLEWSKANELTQDINFPSNMLYAKTLLAAAHLFDDAALEAKANALFDVIRARSFDGTFFRDNEVYNGDGIPVSPGERTETCQYYAFFTGTATPETYPQLWHTLITDFGPKRAEKGLYPEIYPANAFIGNYLRLMLLDENGLYEKLIEESKDYFLYMAERTGTLWENTGDYASCNHGFASYAAPMLIRAEENLKK